MLVFALLNIVCLLAVIGGIVYFMLEYMKIRKKIYDMKSIIPSVEGISNQWSTVTVPKINTIFLDDGEAK